MRMSTTSFFDDLCTHRNAKSMIYLIHVEILLQQAVW